MLLKLFNETSREYKKNAFKALEISPFISSFEDKPIDRYTLNNLKL